MPELLDPPAVTTAPADHIAEPPRPREVIMAEVRALGEIIRDPDTPPEERKAARLRILLELMPELGRDWTEEENANYYEVMRGIDSHRPPGHKLFEKILAEEAS